MCPLLRELLSYLSPSFIISVVYMDPGNQATNISGDVKFGPTLLRVIVPTSVVVIGIQVLATKFDIATGKGMVQFCQERSLGPAVVLLWATAKLAVVAADMAEIIGTVIEFGLVFFLPLWAGSVLVAVSSFILFGVWTAHKRGFRWVEFTIMSLVGVIALAFVFEMALAKPAASTVVSGLIPTVSNALALYIVIGILGVTVIPHNVYLRPYAVQDRRDRLIESDGDTKAAHRRHSRPECLDTVVALFDTMFMNAAMLTVAAAALQRMGIKILEETYVTLSGVFGTNANLTFDVVLIAVGLSSSPVVTIADQTVMDGFLGLDINVWLRRPVMLVSSLLIITVGFDPTSVLVASQVALSFELPFVLTPLLWLTHEAPLMGNFRSRATTTNVLGVAIAVIVTLNDWLLYSTFLG